MRALVGKRVKLDSGKTSNKYENTRKINQILYSIGSSKKSF